MDVPMEIFYARAKLATEAGRERSCANYNIGCEKETKRLKAQVDAGIDKISAMAR